jgi:hypothetical protein
LGRVGQPVDERTLVIRKSDTEISIFLVQKAQLHQHPIVAFFEGAFGPKYVVIGFSGFLLTDNEAVVDPYFGVADHAEGQHNVLVARRLDKTLAIDDAAAPTDIEGGRLPTIGIGSRGCEPTDVGVVR